MTAAYRHEPCEHVALPGGDVPLSAPHVLVVEDHPAIQDLLRWTLELAGYRTTVCAGEQAALTRVEQAMQAGDCPAVLLLDLSFPDTNATDFLRLLRLRWSNACVMLPQIIVLTTSKEVQAELAPPERVMLKPFHIQDLLTLIQQVIPCSSPSADQNEQENPESLRMLSIRL
jgi:CheY-like chemotaxis protein